MERTGGKPAAHIMVSDTLVFKHHKINLYFFKSKQPVETFVEVLMKEKMFLVMWGSFVFVFQRLSREVTLMSCYNVCCFLILWACNTENRSADHTTYYLYCVSCNSYGAGIVPKYELKSCNFFLWLSVCINVW